MEEVISYYEKQTMTLLDHYASLALAGIIANEGVGDDDDDDEPHELMRKAIYSRMVRDAFEIADCAMAEREEYGLEK
jgi:hypothetical protein